MSNETRELHGVRAGEYSYRPARGIAGILSNERNALAWLLTLPWTTDLWSCEGVPFLRSSQPYPTSDELAMLLMQAQAIIPSLTAQKLGRAIRTLALANPRTAPPPQVPMMTAKANGATYAQMTAAGWTYAQLREYGYML